MLHKGKLFVFVGSALIVLYGISAAFLHRPVRAKDDAYRELAVFMDALKKINEDYAAKPPGHEQGAGRRVSRTDRCT